jgi:glucosyl-3-phosphoglycerate synthase
VGEIVRALGALRAAGAIDEIVVIDAGSEDGTAQVAEGEGAKVLQQDELLEDYGPVLGKGDAMWRALSVLEGDLVCFLDADTEGFSAHFATGLLGPLVCERDVSFVKAHYRRPLARPGSGDGRAPVEAGSGDGSPRVEAGSGDGLPPVRAGSREREGEGGGRVNHLTARPALALFYPELSHIRQPLAGEVGARRELLERLPFTTGYGVEVGMLIDAWQAVGLEGLAQVDLDEHLNPHQPLSALTPMATTVLATIAVRLEQEGRLIGPVPDAPAERPPLATLRVA